MNTNQFTIYELYRKLYYKMKKQQFIIDKTGAKMVELMHCAFDLDPQLGGHLNIADIAITNDDYVKRQIQWCLSENLDVSELVPYAKIWNECKGNDNTVNSNYGWCVYSKQNHSQFEKALQALLQQKQSRRGMIIYTRPTMHEDYKQNGKNDFLCTQFNQFLIRNNKLEMFYVMRSNDARYGLFINFPWAITVYNRMFDSLKQKYPELEYGMIHWYSTSFHLYQRHFKMLNKMFEKQHITLLRRIIKHQKDKRVVQV